VPTLLVLQLREARKQEPLLIIGGAVTEHEPLGHLWGVDSLCKPVPTAGNVQGRGAGHRAVIHVLERRLALWQWVKKEEIMKIMP